MSVKKTASALRVLAIAGSPRRGGNTDHLLNQVVSSAASLGAQIKQIILSDLQIAPCRHCDCCLQTGKCAIDDDMQWIHHELREADRVIVASPIFFMGVTAQTKAMIDRCQALWVIKYVLKFPLALKQDRQRHGFFISVGGTKYNNLFQPAIATVRSWFKTLDIEYGGELTFSGMDSRDAISQDTSALSAACSFGKKIVAD